MNNLNQKKEDQKPSLPITVEEMDKLVMDCLEIARNKTKSPQRIWDEQSILARRTIVIDYIKQGLAKYRVVQELMKRWGLCKGSANTYFNDALNYLKEEIADVNKYNYEIALSRLESIVEDSLSNNNRKDAMAAMDMINKIQGLYKEKIEVKEDKVIEFRFGE